MPRDYFVFVVHAGALGGFLLALVAARRPILSRPASSEKTEFRAAAHSSILVVLHFISFGILYFGLGHAVITQGVPDLLPFQRTIGAIIIIGGACLMCWAVIFFRSWRIQAKIEAGHELATGGPFAFVRHPIYAGMDLLALGTAVWAPTLAEWIAVALVALLGDLRGRIEERLLIQVFGSEYQGYMRRTKRFVPGVC